MASFLLKLAEFDFLRIHHIFHPRLGWVLYEYS